VRHAIEAAILVVQSGIPVARMELVDVLMLEAINRFAGLDYRVAPTPFFELHGTPAAVAEQTALRELTADCGGEAFEAAADPAERNRLWQARHDAHYASLAMRPGAKVLGTDVCVPISRLAECIVATKEDIERASFPITLLGHVGDGNFHLGLLIDPDDPRELEEAKELSNRLVMRALAMDGTCTGEHGVGLGKRRYLHAEHGEAVALMASIKQLLDPKGIMNPGKVLP
jgi:D-lactate dehydrogenase (cytochrome)